jgi:hypothetical protein
VISFLVDQNFNEHILDGLTRRDASLSFTLAGAVGLAAVEDPRLLEWAADRDFVSSAATPGRFGHSPVPVWRPASPCAAYFFRAIGCLTNRRLMNCSLSRVVLLPTSTGISLVIFHCEAATSDRPQKKFHATSARIEHY